MTDTTEVNPRSRVIEGSTGPMPANLNPVIRDPAPMHDIIKTIAEKGDTTALREVMEMQREMIAHEEQRIHAQAVAAFQSEIPAISHNQKVLNKDKSSVRYTYADLDHIMASIRPALARHGLSVTYGGEQKDGRYHATCYVRCGGCTTEATFDAPIDPDAYMTDQQKTASATSFAMRYALIMALGLTSTGEVDDDGRVADRPAGEKLLSYNKWVLENWTTVAQIKESLATNDLSTAAQCWFELSNDDKMILGTIAPSNGGMLTTAERATMKTQEFREAHYGPGEET